MDSPAGLRVGIDVISVNEVAASIERFGDRYLRRVYTPHELETCRGGPQVRASRLAARFAAKEAVMKVLRPDDSSPRWRDIEIWRHDAGWCEVRLHGGATDLAVGHGLGEISVSITHTRDAAAAVAFAVASTGTEA